MAKQNYNKLELTWIGKGEEPKLEPRILIENPEYSYGDPKSENMLIHGDNLLALKALEQDFTEKIKCIYIDPPYNTGAAFEHYDDGIEHSLWLDLMHKRTKILRNLLSKDGVLIVHLDDNEVHYMKVILDEIFGRGNFVTTIAIKSSTPSGLKTTHKDKTIIKTKDLCLVYKKSNELKINPLYVRKLEWDSHFSNYLDKRTLTVRNLVEVLIERNILEQGSKLKDIKITKAFRDFYVENKDSIFQTQPVMPEEHKQKSIESKDRVYSYESEGVINYALNGRRFSFLSNSMNITEDGEDDLSTLLCDFWNDIDFQNTQNEGGVSFPASKKPEKLVKRFIQLFSKEGDIIFDSFLGSGTTASVAHKMGRKWIGVELGEHAKTHCFPRLKAVVDGEQGGISKAVEWKGGGGFKFYNLAPSLLNEDKYGNWIISKEYNAQMLASAVAKQEGFKYEPDEHVYWKQGMSSEKDFIFTTTQFITAELMDKIHEEMQSGESLLIACKSYQEGCEDRHANISIKKIPHMLMGRCEFGKDDYSFNIVNMPLDEEAENWVEPEVTTEKTSKKSKNIDSIPGLFD